MSDACFLEWFLWCWPKSVFNSSTTTLPQYWHVYNDFNSYRYHNIGSFADYQALTSPRVNQHWYHSCIQCIYPLTTEPNYWSKFKFKYFVVWHNITMTSWWARLRLKSPASRLFTQIFIQMQIIENIIALCHCPLCGEFIGDRWILRTNDQ